MPTPMPARPPCTRSRPRRTTPRAAWSQGLTALCDKYGIPRETIDVVFHGTTIATNAILEHDGAVTGMITTGGYRDILHIGRHQRPQHYSIMQDIPWQDRPLVKRRHRKTVTERLVPPRGEVLEPLDEEGVRQAVRELKEAGVAGDRHLLPVLLSRSGARGARHGDRARGISRVLRHHLLVGVAAVPRVRALHHDGDERLRRAQGAQLRDAARNRRSRPRASRPTCASWRRTAAWRRRPWWPSGRCSPCCRVRRPA